jgi:hypothetical protein
MSIAELQKKLIEKISNTHDLKTLEEISNWIGLDDEPSPVYLFSEEQLNKLEEA